MNPELLARCREYEGRFPLVPLTWTHHNQYATPQKFRRNMQMMWSFGVSKEIMFEEGIRKSNRKVKIYTWDPTPISQTTVRASTARVIHTNKAYDPSEQLMQFYTTDPKQRCWSLENPTPDQVVAEMTVRTENLATISQRLGTHVDLIKLDIEGRWYEMLSEILALDLSVRMIQVECEMYFGPADQEFAKLDHLVNQFLDRDYVIWCNRRLEGVNIELCFDRHRRS